MIPFTILVAFRLCWWKPQFQTIKEPKKIDIKKILPKNAGKLVNYDTIFLEMILQTITYVKNHEKTQVFSYGFLAFPPRFTYVPGIPRCLPPASKRRDEPRRGPLKALRSRLVQPTELRLVPARRPGARHVGEPLG